MNEVMIPITFFATVFGIFYLYYTTRNRERLALIEKGADASIFKEEKNMRGSLKFGMLFVGVSLGIIVGSIVEALTRLEEPVAYFSMIFFFGGLSLIIFYFLEKGLRRSEQVQHTQVHPEYPKV